MGWKRLGRPRSRECRFYHTPSLRARTSRRLQQQNRVPRATNPPREIGNRLEEEQPKHTRVAESWG